MMRISLLVGLLLAFFLASCSVGTRADAVVPGSAAAGSLTDDEAACAAQGGELRALGRLQRVQCVVPYADAGTSCTTGSDCSGNCLAANHLPVGAPASGTCQRDAGERFGCRQRIEGGVAQAILCVD